MSGPAMARRVSPCRRVTQGTVAPYPKRRISSIRISTSPTTPLTSRTTSDALPLGGMKSIIWTAPVAVSKVVSSTRVSGR